jgi:hypothetical protein
MSSERLTPLEFSILQVFYEEYGMQGFPPPGAISVNARKNTGAGRIISLETKIRVHCHDGYLDMGGRFIEMEEVSNGLMAVVSIVHAELDQLEIATYGDESWDGEERGWRII